MVYGVPELRTQATAVLLRDLPWTTVCLSLCMPSLVSHAIDHSSLLSRRLQIQHAAADRDAHIASAQNSLSTVVEPARLRRAEFKSREERVQEIWDGVNALRSANDQRE